MGFWLKEILLLILSCGIILLVNFLVRKLATWHRTKQAKAFDTGFTLKVQLYQFIAHLLILFPSYVFIFKDFYQVAAITVGVVLGLNISLYFNYQAALKFSTQDSTKESPKEEQEAEKT